MHEFDRRYLWLAAPLILLGIGISLFVYPAWSEMWWLLVITVAVGVVAFIANFRQAFERKNEEDKRMEKPKDGENSGGQSGGIHIEHSSSGGNTIAINGDGNVIKIEKPHIDTHQSTFRPGSAPPLPSLIIGRDDDMKTLKDRLGHGKKDRGNVQVLTAIKGWPGVGKTTIASALAHDPELAAQFPDGVLWTSLGQEPNILSEMAAWARALGTDELLKARSIEEAQAQLAALLRNKRMLLIIDDVWQVEHAMPFKVGGNGCATLLTTRLDEIARVLAPVAGDIYRLKVLKDEDALELLRQLASTVVGDYPSESLVLVQELEGLPLAIQVAGRLLNTEAGYGFGVIELIDDLRAGAKLLESKAPADRADLVQQTTPTIAVLLQKSLDRLDDGERNCYAYLGVFAPKPATFDLGAMKFVWQLDDPRPTVKTLIDRGLLEYVPEMNRYQMHALLVMLAKTLLTEDR